MRIYAYLIRPGAGFRIQCPHAQGAQKGLTATKKEKKMHTVESDSTIHAHCGAFWKLLFFLLSSVMQILESDSQCDAHIGVWLSSVLQILESDSVVWCISWSLTQQCDAHFIVWLSSVMHILKSDSVVWCTSWSLTQQCDGWADYW